MKYSKENIDIALKHVKEHSKRLEDEWNEYFKKENESNDICKDCEYKKLHDLDEIEY